MAKIDIARNGKPAVAQGLRRQVADALREAILRGEYPPGTPLGEVEISKRFGVSRGPVREAIVELEKEFLVRTYPNRGSFVAELKEHEFDEILRLRAVLEPLAMENAQRYATPAKIASLHSLLLELEESAVTADPHLFLRKDFEFHLAIWEMSQQPLLQEILIRITKPMFVFSAVLQDRYLRRGMDWLKAARTHQNMLDYVAGKTSMTACECFQPIVEISRHADRKIIFGS
jgi:DNA-binding GntR family transcriptional regulator